jgi:hypothetical protein
MPPEQAPNAQLQAAATALEAAGGQLSAAAGAITSAVPQVGPRLVGWVCARCGIPVVAKVVLQQIGSECPCGGLLLPVRAGDGWMWDAAAAAPTFAEGIRRTQDLWLAVLTDLIADWITAQISRPDGVALASGGGA